MMKEAEYHEHVKTYRGFVQAAAWCISGVVVVLLLMLIFLV